MREILLGIDTATPYLALALWSPRSGVLARSTERVGREHSARFIGALEQACRAAGITTGSLSAICAGAGPGSYTGIRVGGAAALGLARALALPLYGCDTLAAIAFGGLESDEEGLAALDARRGNLYVGRYRRRGEELVVIDPPRKRSRGEVLAGHPHLRLVEEREPDPVFIARSALSEAPFQPVYL